MMKFPTEWDNKSHVPNHQPVSEIMDQWKMNEDWFCLNADIDRYMDIDGYIYII